MNAQAVAAGLDVPVMVVPPPGGDVALDLDSDWIIDKWVRAKASRFGETVKSDYEAKDADAPDEARQLLDGRDQDTSPAPADAVF